MKETPNNEALSEYAKFGEIVPPRKELLIDHEMLEVGFTKEEAERGVKLSLSKTDQPGQVKMQTFVETVEQGQRKRYGHQEVLQSTDKNQVPFKTVLEILNKQLYDFSASDSGLKYGKPVSDVAKEIRRNFAVVDNTQLFDKEVSADELDEAFHDPNAGIDKPDDQATESKAA